MFLSRLTRLQVKRNLNFKRIRTILTVLNKKNKFTLLDTLVYDFCNKI